MKNKLLLLITGLFVVLFSAFTSDKTITIFMIGDSTMANKPLEGDNQERGWGQVLGGFFSEEIVIDNTLYYQKKKKKKLSTMRVMK